MKHLLLFVYVIFETLNFEISRWHLADCIKECDQSVCRSCSTIVFPLSTNQVIVFWRRRCRRTCLSSPCSWRRNVPFLLYQNPCGRCNGSGNVQEMDETVQCSICFGTGYKRCINKNKHWITTCYYILEIILSLDETGPICPFVFVMSRLAHLQRIFMVQALSWLAILFYLYLSHCTRVLIRQFIREWLWYILHVHGTLLTIGQFIRSSWFHLWPSVCAVIGRLSCSSIWYPRNYWSSIFSHYHIPHTTRTMIGAVYPFVYVTSLT